MRRTAVKLLQYSTPEPRSECVLWDGGQNSKGYGYVRVPVGELPEFPRMARVHRVAYWIFRGPYDLALDVHHTCHLRLCMNPYHIEPETSAENSSEGAIYQWHEEELYDYGF